MNIKNRLHSFVHSYLNSFKVQKSSFLVNKLIVDWSLQTRQETQIVGFQVLIKKSAKPILLSLNIVTESAQNLKW